MSLAKMPTTLFAAGFNAHGQLTPHNSSDEGKDVCTFHPIAADVEVLFAGWSSTVLRSTSTGQISSRGHQQIVNSNAAVMGEAKAIGTHEGLLGYLNSDESKLFWMTSSTKPGDSGKPEDQPVHLVDITKDTSPSLAHIALAANDRIALTFRQAPNGKLCHIVEFANPDSFLAWFHNPSGEGLGPAKHHMLPGRPKQLVANTATFLLLMEGGEVYSWGDGRYRSLGRGIDVVPADVPGVVEALGGLRIVKVTMGGWMSAAVSADGAAYLWGAGDPGADAGRGKIACLGGVGVGEVALVEVLDAQGEVLDVVDVAIGDAHVAIVTGDGQLWVVGENRNGQLGLGEDDEERVFVEEWTVVPGLRNVRRVVCGPRATFVVVDEGGSLDGGIVNTIEP